MVLSFSRKSFFRSLFILALLFTSCERDLFFEEPKIGSELVDLPQLRVVTYNIHGGKGPNGEGDAYSNLSSFRSLLQGEDILCFQEVEPQDWETVKHVFSEYPYRYYVTQRSTKFGTTLIGGNAILSKWPIRSFEYRLIQTDPGGDRWERKALHVTLYVGGDAGFAHLFAYHNTYNWHESDSESERAGFTKFLQYVRETDIAQGEITVLAGDMNLSLPQCSNLMEQAEYPHRTSNWVDHIFSDAKLLDAGSYATYEMLLSDHNAVWGIVDNSP